MNKQAIIDALRAFTCQRPGFDMGNYATWADYWREYERRVQAYEAQDMTTSDAQGIVDIEYPMPQDLLPKRESK